jgi:hypothetical protein
MQSVSENGFHRIRLTDKKILKEAPEMQIIYRCALLGLLAMSISACGGGDASIASQPSGVSSSSAALTTETIREIAMQGTDLSDADDLSDSSDLTDAVDVPNEAIQIVF